MAYQFHDTAHIEKRAGERGFSVEEAMLTINEPASSLKTLVRKGKSRRIHLVVLSRVWNNILVVVAEVKGNECWIITGYWEEQR